MGDFDSEMAENAVDDNDDVTATDDTFVAAGDFIDVLTQSTQSNSDDSQNLEPTIVMTALPVTGEPRVDDAIARLSDLSFMPVDEHVAVFEDVQRRLHDTLADLAGQ